jgi:putative MATE family efflux protein
MLAIPSSLKRIVDFYHDREYFRSLRRLALPIIIQQFILSGLNMVNVVLIGQKGDASVAAVGLANQVFFLLNLVHFGIISGAAMFTAQFWGKGDLPNLRRVLGLCLALSMVASLIFLLFAQLMPAQILGLYSSDPAVIALGSRYLRIFSWTFIFFAITFSYALVLRSTGDVRTPTVISVTALSLITLLSYGLIFGRFGLPEMGLEGAALAALIARGLECVLLLIVTYTIKSPVAATLTELFSFDISFLGRVLRPIFPVVLNEIFWALGITSYNVIYGHIGTDAFAAMSIVATIDQMALVLFQGIAHATAVMVGNRIGAGQEEAAHRYAGRSLGLGILLGLLAGAILLLLRAPVLSLYKVTAEVTSSAYRVLTIISLFLWMRFNNMAIVIGILRSGGDTRFSLLLDGIIIWVVGVPLSAMGAFVFHLPVHWVYLFAMSEETTKWILGLHRYVSRKWIHNLAQAV